MAEYINTLNKKLSQAEMETNAKYIASYLLAKGWSLNAIAGLLGNYQHESSINPNVFEGYTNHSSDLGVYGYGLPQWTPWLGTTTYDTPEEQRNYHGSNNPTFGRWCLDNNRDKSLMETQLDYIDTGLGGYKVVSGYPESYEEFKKSTKSPDYLAELYYVNYERSKAGTWGPRPESALEWYEFLTGTELPDTPTPSPGTTRSGLRALDLILYTRRRYKGIVV